MRRETANLRTTSEAGKRGPSVQERQLELIRFYERYEELVETLCDAAQYGPTPKLERSYEANRDWMRSEYVSMRPYVVGYLQVEEGTGDAFEALVASDNLGQFLNSDDGNMISRITATREALTLYGEHLRQLAARTA